MVDVPKDPDIICKSPKFQLSVALFGYYGDVGTQIQVKLDIQVLSGAQLTPHV